MSLRKIAEHGEDLKKFRNYENSNPGEKMVQTYKLAFNEAGVKELVPDDLYDIQKMIDSYEQEVNINKIIERFVSGDPSVLDRARGFYADVSKMPKNLIQVYQNVKDGEKAFMSLPAELRELYDNNFFAFIKNPEIMEEYERNKFIESAKEVKEPEKVEVKGDDE